MIKSYKTKRLIGDIVVYTILTILSIIWVLPIVWIVMTSFSGEKSAFIDHVIPSTWTFNNYIELFTKTETFNYPRAFLNTLIISIFSCVIFTGSCVLCMTEIGPSTKSGMPLISAVGFLFSIALGIYSVRQMSGKK